MSGPPGRAPFGAGRRRSAGRVRGVSPGAVLLLLAAAGLPAGLPGGARPVAAQDVTSDSVPRALAEALVGRGAASARILVGEAPAAFDLEIQEGMELLGGVERENGSAVLVLATDRDPAALRDALAELLAGQGWERLERRPGPSWGFVPAEGVVAPMMLCRGGRETVGLQAVGGDPGLVYLDYHDRGPGSVVPCDVRDQARVEAIRVSLPMPELAAPDGVALAPAGTSTGSGELATAAFLRGDATLESLEGHFGDQLRAQGWRRVEAGEVAASEVVRASLWERPAEGEAVGRDGPGPWIGALTLSRVGDGPVWARFAAHRPGEPRRWMGG